MRPPPSCWRPFNRGSANVNRNSMETTDCVACVFVYSCVCVIKCRWCCWSSGLAHSLNGHSHSRSAWCCPKYCVCVCVCGSDYSAQQSRRRREKNALILRCIVFVKWLFANTTATTTTKQQLCVHAYYWRESTSFWWRAFGTMVYMKAHKQGKIEWKYSVHISYFAYNVCACVCVWICLSTLTSRHVLTCRIFTLSHQCCWTMFVVESAQLLLWLVNSIAEHSIWCIRAHRKHCTLSNYAFQKRSNLCWCCCCSSLFRRIFRGWCSLCGGKKTYTPTLHTPTPYSVQQLRATELPLHCKPKSLTDSLTPKTVITHWSQTIMECARWLAGVWAQ